ncbi:beta-phosphoglucomutase family hydrolase [Celerinatantimonas yamalensis]|uniref:Beta-phosphoglucomutase family hydrolase n=1 Tax=Celerinatantimonas yamalensis TaxID=559956 RepID=A0ABW9G8Q6_9GAMM
MYDHYLALIFDMDGTVIDSLPAHQTAWEQILGQYHIPYTGAQMNYLNGWPALQTVDYLCQHASIHSLDIAAISAEKEALYQKIARKMVVPTPIVDIVKRYAHKPIAIGTGATTLEASTLLAHLGIDTLFPVIVGSDQVKAHKPSPETFLRCAQLLDVAPEHCVVFEDAQAGFDAATAAGMTYVDVRNIWQGHYFDGI